MIVNYLDQEEFSHTLRRTYVELWRKLFKKAKNIDDLIYYFRHEEFSDFFEFIKKIKPNNKLISYYVILLNFWTSSGDKHIKSFFKQHIYEQFILDEDVTKKIEHIIDKCWKHLVNKSTRFPDIKKYDQSVLPHQTKYCILLTILTKYYYKKIQKTYVKKYKLRIKQYKAGFKLFFGTKNNILDSLTTDKVLIPQSASFDLEEACSFLEGDKAILAIYNFNPYDNIEDSIYIPVAINSFSEFASENETLFIPVKTFGDDITIMPVIAQQVSVMNMDEAVNNATPLDDDTVLRPILPNTLTKAITVVAADVQKLVEVSTIDEINLEELDLEELDEINLEELDGIIPYLNTIQTAGGCNKCKKYNKTKK